MEAQAFEEILVLAVKNLHQAYEKKGDYYNAYIYLEKDLKYQNSLYEDYLAKSGEIQNYYTSEQKQAEIELLKKQDAILEAENHRQQILLYMSIVGGVLTAHFGIAFLQKFQKQTESQ